MKIASFFNFDIMMTIEKTLSTIPTDLCQPSDYEIWAERFISPEVMAYIAGGSGSEISLKRNRQAFEKISLLQRALIDCTKGTTQTQLLKQQLRHPILLAPVAAQKLVHPDGEVATAQAANAMEAGMILSTLSSTLLETVAENTEATKWFQLYFQPDKQATLSLVQRAEQAGYQAIVVTLDTAVQTLSPRAQKLGFTLPQHAQPVNLAKKVSTQQTTLTPTQSVIFQGMMSEAPLLADIAWLKAQTRLPIIIKGVMHSKDIEQLLNLNIDGIIVSNHGGRALDGTPASLTLLPTIRRQVGEDFLLLLDGGIRSGYDAFKAIALGADAVCVGRLQMYALAVAGAKGVAHLLKMLRDELELCMALTGCSTLDDIERGALFTEERT